MTTRTGRRRAIALAASDALKAFVDARAACRQLAVNGFYPDPNDAAGTAAAKAICGRCLVRSECLTWALTTREQFGVWGGLSEAERAARRDRTPRDRRVEGRGTTPAPHPVSSVPAAGVSPRQRRRLAELRAS